MVDLLHLKPHAWIDQRTALGSNRHSIDNVQEVVRALLSYDVKRLFLCQLVTSNACFYDTKTTRERMALK